MLPGRPPADDRAGASTTSAEHGVDEAVLSLGYRPDAFLDGLPRRHCAPACALHYAVEPEPLDTAGAIRFAALDAGIDEHVRRASTATCSPTSTSARSCAFHRARGAEGTIAPHAGRRPVALRRRADRRRRPGRGVRREAAARRGADQLHQRRHLRARAVGARPHPGGRRVSIERETFPAMVGRGPSVRARRPTPTGSTPARPSKYLQAQLDLLDGAAGRAEPAISPDAGDRRDAVVERSASSAPGCRVAAGAAVAATRCSCRVRRSAPGAMVDGSIVGPSRDGRARGAIARATWSSATASLGRRWRAALARASGVPGARQMKALVTGGAGFIGSHLVDRLLAEGHSVDVVDDLSTGIARQPGRRPRATGATSSRSTSSTSATPSWSTLIARREPEVVFHLAAQADVRVSVADPRSTPRSTSSAASTCSRARAPPAVGKVVFASSGGTIYGDVDAAETCRSRRSHPQRPLSPYGVAKKAVERLPARLPRAARARVHRRSRSPTCTAHGRTRTARPAWWRSSPARLLAGTAVHDLRRRRQNARLRLRRRRRRRVRPRRPTRAAACSCNIGTGVETSVNDALRDDGGRQPASPRRRCTRPPRPGELARSALDPGRAAIHLGWKPWTDARRRRRRRPRLAPRPAVTLAEEVLLRGGGRSRRGPMPRAASSGRRRARWRRGRPRPCPSPARRRAASSSATQTSVTCISRPSASSVPRRSTTAAMPAQPMATSVRPRATSARTCRTRSRRPRRRRGRAGRRGCGGPSGRSRPAAARPSPRSTFDRSMPALAQTKPCLVSLMMRSPRRRRMRTDSCSTSRLWRQRIVGVDRDEPALGLRHDLLGDDERRRRRGVQRRIGIAIVVIASAMRSARSSPGWTSPMPSTPAHLEPRHVASSASARHDGLRERRRDRPASS